MFLGDSSDLLEEIADLMPGTRAAPFKNVEELRAAMGRSSVEHEWQVFRRLFAITTRWHTAPFAQAWKKVDAFQQEYCEIASEAPSFSVSACTFLPPSQFRFLTAINTAHRSAVDSVGLLLQYRQRHEKWPKSLEELTPKFVKKLPIDPFSGKPLVYRRSTDGKTFKLYSIAGNQTDDGGRHDEDWKRDGDYVFWPQ